MNVTLIGLRYFPRMPKEQERAGINLLQGTLDLLVLRVLVAGPLHGYAISQRLAELSDKWFSVEPQTCSAEQRRSTRSILFSKFLPGLSLLISPLAGMMGLAVGTFLVRQSAVTSDGLLNFCEPVLQAAAAPLLKIHLQAGRKATEV